MNTPSSLYKWSETVHNCTVLGRFIAFKIPEFLTPAILISCELNEGCGWNENISTEMFPYFLHTIYFWIFIRLKAYFVTFRDSLVVLILPFKKQLDLHLNKLLDLDLHLQNECRSTALIFRTYFFFPFLPGSGFQTNNYWFWIKENVFNPTGSRFTSTFYL